MLGHFKEQRASTMLTSSTRRTPFPLRSSPPLPPNYDVPDNASQLSHVPLPTFSIADPQALFTLSRPMFSPSPGPSSRRPKVLNKMGTLGKKVVHEVLGGQGNNPPARREMIPTFGRGGAARPKLRVYGATPISSSIPLRVKSLDTLGISRTAATINVQVNTSVTRQNDYAHTLSDTSASSSVVPSTSADFVFVDVPKVEPPELPSPTRYTTTSMYENESHSHHDFLSMVTRSRSVSRERRRRSPIPPVPPLPRSASQPPVDFPPMAGPSRPRHVPARLALSTDLFQPPHPYASPSTPEDEDMRHLRTMSASMVFPPTPSSGSIEFRSFTRSNTMTTQPPRRDRGRTRRRDQCQAPIQTRSLSVTANDGSDETRRLILEEEREARRTRRPLPSPPAALPPLPFSAPANQPSMQSMRFDQLGSRRINPRSSFLSDTSASSDFALSLPSFARPGSSMRGRGLPVPPRSPSPHVPLTVSPPSMMGLYPAPPQVQPSVTQIPQQPALADPISGLFTAPSSATVASTMQMQQALELFVALANVNLALAAPLIQAQASAPPTEHTPTLSASTSRDSLANNPLLITHPDDTLTAADTESISNYPLLTTAPSHTPTPKDTTPDSRTRSLRNSVAPSQQTPTPPGSPRLSRTRISTPSSGAHGPSFRLSLFPEGTVTTNSVLSSPIDEDPVPPMPTITWNTAARSHVIDTRPSTALSMHAGEDAPSLPARPHSWIGEVRGWDELEKGAGLGITLDDFGQGSERDTTTLEETTVASNSSVSGTSVYDTAFSGSRPSTANEIDSIRSRAPRPLPKIPVQFSRGSYDSSWGSFTSFRT